MPSPVLDPIGSFALNLGEIVTFTAHASGQGITYSIDDGAPDATINPSTGEFSWVANVGATSVVRVTAMDNGEPASSDYEDVSIRVSNPASLVRGPQRTPSNRSAAAPPM